MQEETGEGGQFYAPIPHGLGERGSSAHILARSEEICLKTAK
jgi:hypothetical protein